ncbi:hypothetical protein EVAR_16128_1 [Eumeta japonica]|uniref:Uncharacterized protein n=1 Tax=Eumeta variegata TaxID=151549 RepID=A0A4C1UK54_EUMVA|nr:hypothetical protein EVAR_16128_1 [Eumeta japonica]
MCGRRGGARGAAAANGHFKSSRDIKAPLIKPKSFSGLYLLEAGSGSHLNYSKIFVPQKKHFTIRLCLPVEAFLLNKPSGGDHQRVRRQTSKPLMFAAIINIKGFDVYDGEHHLITHSAHTELSGVSDSLTPLNFGAEHRSTGIFIRGVDKEFTVTEELLALQSLKRTTTGEDTFNEVQKNLCSKSMRLQDVMILAVETINFIQSQGLNHAGRRAAKLAGKVNTRMPCPISICMIEVSRKATKRRYTGLCRFILVGVAQAAQSPRPRARSRAKTPPVILHLERGVHRGRWQAMPAKLFFERLSKMYTTQYIRSRRSVSVVRLAERVVLVHRIGQRFRCGRAPTPHAAAPAPGRSVIIGASARRAHRPAATAASAYRASAPAGAPIRYRSVV